MTTADKLAAAVQKLPANTGWAVVSARERLSWIVIALITVGVAPCGCAVVSARDDGGPAYPVASTILANSYGMTLRDWFAGQALAGIYASEGAGDQSWRENAATQAFMTADAMLAERSK